MIFGVGGVSGLLIGRLSTGFVLAVFMANVGGAWDNAKNTLKRVNSAARAQKFTKLPWWAIPLAIHLRIPPDRV